jgi:hypothetical protein
MAEPLLHRRFGNRTWDGILCGTAATALGAIGVILWLPGATTLVVFVLLTLGCHGPLSPFLPATYEPILLLYGQDSQVLAPGRGRAPLDAGRRNRPRHRGRLRGNHAPWPAPAAPRRAGDGLVMAMILVPWPSALHWRESGRTERIP